VMYGRGVSDMKGGIAAGVSASSCFYHTFSLTSPVDMGSIGSHKDYKGDSGTERCGR